MIAPSIGRVVWVRNRAGVSEAHQPEAGFIVHVHADGLINVGGFNQIGTPFAATSIPLRQDDDAPPKGCYAEWMPYQIGQAAKTEQLQAQMAQQQKNALAPAKVNPVTMEPSKK